MKKNFFLKFIAVAFFAITTKTVSAQDAYTGEIRLFAGNFAPRGWALCNGQIMSIMNNSALFSLLGTYYGGDGKSTFALPDLRGRVPVGCGQGPGLSNWDLGEKDGAEKVTLTISQMPAHSHVVNLGGPASGNTGNNTTITADAAAGTVTKTVMTQPVGNSLPVSVMQPGLGLSYIICLNGLYPSRN